MIVGLTLICTRKYHEFLGPLLDDVAAYFFDGDERRVYVFTDDERYDLDRPGLTVTQILIPSYGFPEASLHRFRFFAEHADELEGHYLFFMDVDMRIVAPVGRDMLPKYGQQLVGVHHARCWSADGTWETRFESNAYVRPDNRIVYYAGGVFGGHRSEFLQMARALDRLIDEDVARGTVGVWHDESYLNWYFSVFQPTILPPSYCFPPNPAPELSDFSAKIECIIKHARIRS